MVDVVPAFDSVAVYFDGPSSESVVQDAVEIYRDSDEPPPRTHVVPVCYEAGPDIGEVCAALGLSREEFIARHAFRPYPCRGIGFCPGFAYLGWLDEALDKLGRRESPRLRVEAGSVAIAGRMTAIYPLDRPGGWWLVGRTPLTLADVEEGYFPIAVGDLVEFRPISVPELVARSGERL